MIVDELSNDGDTNGPGMQEGHPMQAGARGRARKPFSQAKLGRMSAPAKATLEKAHQLPRQSPTVLAMTALSNVDTTSASYMAPEQSVVAERVGFRLSCCRLGQVRMVVVA
jgi:hypothetical protein